MNLSTRHASPAMIVALAAALFVALGGVGAADTGGNFILGKANSAGAKTSLTAGGLNDKALAITNLNAGSSATALGLTVAGNRPPLIVNSTQKVANLNADLVDGLDTTELPYWGLHGNAGTSPSTHFIGTTDLVPLHFRVDDQVALRLIPGTFGSNIIAGATTNTINSPHSGTTIFGGTTLAPNTVTSDFASVLGGVGNTATNSGAAVLAGSVNSAAGVDSIAAGRYAQTTGLYTVALGEDVHATHGNSFALGRHASALHDRSFVWNGSLRAVTSFANDTFTAASPGGARFISGFAANGIPSAGVELKSGNSSWSSLSDRASKHNFRRVSAQTVLRRLDRIPITRWSYKAQRPSIRHIGPMAQDFRAAFGLGEDNRHIDTIDSDGVALAAIQGLYRQNKALQRQNRGLRAQLSAQNARLTRLEHVFAAHSR